MTLLVDVGNTRLKWRWLPGPAGVPLGGVLPVAEVNAETLAEQFAAGWGGKPEPCTRRFVRSLYRESSHGRHD